MRHVSELLAPGFDRPVLLCRGKMPRARGMAAYVGDDYRAFYQPKFDCGCCEGLWCESETLCVQSLPQGWGTGGPRAACGPRVHFMRPAKAAAGCTQNIRNMYALLIAA